MPSEGQAGLGDFGAGSDRPAAEAMAVAGRGDAVAAADASATAANGHVEVCLQAVDYTIERDAEGREAPVIHVFGRTADGTSEHVRVVGFRPYFYVPDDEAEALRDDDRVTGIEPGYIAIDDASVTRVYGRTPRDVGDIREGTTHYEADVLFPNRFLIDMGISSGLRIPAARRDDGAIEVGPDAVEPVDLAVDPRVFFFDIEVDDRRGFPEDGEEPIISIAAHDSGTDGYLVWLFEAPEGLDGADVSLDGFETLEGDTAVEVRSFEAEAAMLDDFLSYVEASGVDLLSGWNADDFDVPYLLDRLDRLDPDADEDLSIERLSRVGEVWRSNFGAPDVKGRVVFDLLYAYRRTQFTELDSYRLEDVAQEELGVGKERYPGAIGDLWEEDPQRLLEYNLRDVELCVELDRKQEVIAFWDEVRRLVGCQLADAPTPGDTVDMYILHKVHGDWVLPSRGRQQGEAYEGGAVFEPITGIRENVGVFDLASLYPNCMRTINASPETKVDPSTYEGETHRAPNGIHFRKEPDGIIRSLVSELLEERDSLKVNRDTYRPDSEEFERLDRQQQSVKVIMNSLYGVLGWVRFRLYDQQMGAAVTATGREVIQHTKRVVEDVNKTVIYGDTDSAMLSISDSSSVADAIDIGFELEGTINASYDEFAQENLDADEHYFEIEFEKLYRRFFQAGKKKRYAGHLVWSEGKEVDDIDITGFEYQRSDIAPITKEVQHEVLERIVREGDVEGVKEYLHDVIERFENGEFSPEEVAIPGGIGKRLDNYETDTAHVRGAKYANVVLGTNFDRGAKPKRLYLRKVHPAFFRELERERGLDPNANPVYGEFKADPDVICFEYADQLPEAFEVDWEKMLDRTLRGPIDRILAALDLTWDEVRSGQTQTGLGQFG
ncbi:MAG: DNA-directed DNA polymerase [Halobacteriota archaeon]